MWICKKCNEENEDSFDACWKCFDKSDLLKKIEDTEEEKLNALHNTGIRGRSNSCRNIFIYIITFIIIGIPTVVLLAILTEGEKTAVPGVAGVVFTFLVAKLIIAKLNAKNLKK